MMVKYMTEFLVKECTMPKMYLPCFQLLYQQGMVSTMPAMICNMLVSQLRGETGQTRQMESDGIQQTNPCAFLRPYQLFLYYVQICNFQSCPKFLSMLSISNLTKSHKRKQWIHSGMVLAITCSDCTFLAGTVPNLYSRCLWPKTLTSLKLLF